MPSLNEELQQAQKERLDAETKLHQDLSDAEKKATGNRIKELKAREKEISNLRKKSLEEEKKAIENKRKELSGVSDSLANTQAGLVGASKSSPISKMMAEQTTLLTKIDKATNENVKLQKGDLFAEEEANKQLQRDEKDTELLERIAENTEQKGGDVEKKKGGWWKGILLALAAITGLVAGFVAGLGITLLRFVRFFGKLLFGGLFKKLGTLFESISNNKWIKNIKTFFTNIATKVGDFLKAGKGKWTKWIDDIGLWFRKIGSKIDDVIKGKFPWIDKIRDFFRMVGGKFAKIKFTWVDELLDFLRGIGRIGLKVGGKVKGGIIASVMKVVDTVFDAVRGFFRMFGRLFGFFRKVGGVFTKFFKIGAKFGKILGPIGIIISIVDGVIQSVKGAFAGYKDGGFLGALKGGLAGLFKSIVGDIVNLGSKLIGWILGALGFEKLAEAFKTFDIMKYFDPALQIVTSILQWFPDILTTLWSSVKELGTGIGNLASGIWNTLKTGLVNIVPNIFGLKDWLAGKFGITTEGAKEAAERRREKLTGIAQIIKSNILTRMPDVFGLKGWLSERWGIPLRDAMKLTGKTQHMMVNIGKQIKESIAKIAYKVTPARFHGWISDWFGVPKPTTTVPEKTDVVKSTASDARIQEINKNSSEISDWKVLSWMKSDNKKAMEGSPTVINNSTNIASTNQGMVVPLPAHDTTAKESMLNSQKGTRP